MVVRKEGVLTRGVHVSGFGSIALSQSDGGSGRDLRQVHCGKVWWCGSSDRRGDNGIVVVMFQAEELHGICISRNSHPSFHSPPLYSTIGASYSTKDTPERHPPGSASDNKRLLEDELHCHGSAAHLC